MKDEQRGETLPNATTGSAGEEPASSPSASRFFWLRLCFRALASLQLAVVLIAVYAVVLAAATFVEKYHGPAAARAMVYDTAWFAAIHIVLAVNVLCAMLIRLPWRPRQIGFLVTHGGILLLLAGCALTRWAGVEAQLAVYEGHANHIAQIDRHQSDAENAETEPLELGFQVYLHQFRRRLDPGSGMPSHYSSRVDFLDRGDPPKMLLEDQTIKLNAPVDFTDPKTGRTYRLFQASFEGPWLPGDEKFDQLAGNDRGRDQIYMSRLSMNYDPGRWPKYVGSLLIVVGIGIVYYLRRVLAAKPLAVSHSPPASTFLGGSLLASVALLSLGGTVRAADEPLDWTNWQHLPVLSEGRVAPLDTFARQAVRAICGRPNPTLNGPDTSAHGRPREYSAAELLFAWLAEPEKWEDVAFLPADDKQLRVEIGLPLEDALGRRLRCVSPRYVKESDTIRRRFKEIMHRAEVGGKDFRLTDVETRLDRMFDAYGAYRALTCDPRSQSFTSRRFDDRAQLAAGALKRLAKDARVGQRISSEPEIRAEVKMLGNAWGKLLGVLRDGDFSLKKSEPAVAEFRHSGDRLASRLSSTSDATSTALAANLRHQAAEMQMALYDDGESLRLVPALDADAMEESRTPEDDASPWLGFQALIYGSRDLLQAYPWPELMRVRRAFADVKAAYADRGAADRGKRFFVAIRDFAESLRALAEKIEPLRRQLPLRHRDPELMVATAYPPAGSTTGEVCYNRFDPFFWSWAVSLAATLCLLLAVGRWQKPVFCLGAAVLVVGQAIAIIGMGFRGYITGLVPLTGMFETVEFVALYAGLLGLWFALSPLWPWNLGRQCIEGSALQCPLCRSPADSPTASTTPIDLAMQRRLFALAGAIVSFTAAVLAYYAPATVMHRDIGSVTPILRDNYWLAVHVVTIMASYASAAIALILGCIALGYYLFGRYRDESRVGQSQRGPTVSDDEPDEHGGTALRLSHPTDVGSTRRRPPEACGILAGFIYTAIKITVLLLAAGTILGALWADEAWGHFWSWDPKETWALVSLLVYLLILHLRLIILRTRSLGWSGDFLMAMAAVFGFTAILCTWYFVNFVWGSGMHSYGSGSGGMWAVIGAIAATWLFLLAAAARHLFEITGHSAIIDSDVSLPPEDRGTAGSSS
jgi:ABC-type transport system involved in cytochrome c biogenesis permease subunit